MVNRWRYAADRFANELGRTCHRTSNAARRGDFYCASQRRSRHNHEQNDSNGSSAATSPSDNHNTTTWGHNGGQTLFTVIASHWRSSTIHVEPQQRQFRYGSESVSKPFDQPHSSH